MSGDYFRPRVDPSARPVPAQPWPDRTDPDDLLSPFDVIRRTLDARQAAEHEAGPATATATSGPAWQAQPVVPARAAPAFDPAPRWAEPTATDPTSVPADHTDSFTRKSDSHRTSRGRLTTVALVAGALAFCAGAATVAVTHDQSHPKTASAPAPSTASAAPAPNALRAIAWVDGSVGPTHVVACDANVCALLRAHGFPASSLVVASGLAGVEQADTVVLTPVLRAQLGTRVNAIISTEPLAVFGSGAGRVEIAAVALDGPGVYAQGLIADRQSRRAAGTALLGNRHLIVDPAAGALLSGGLVDTRVCALLALLSGSHTIVIAGFTPIAPGAGPDIPSAGVVIESVDGQAATGQSTPAAQLLATIQAQQDPYLPMPAGPGVADGRPGLRIAYSQPGPLGLLGAETS